MDSYAPISETIKRKPVRSAVANNGICTFVNLYLVIISMGPFDGPMNGQAVGKSDKLSFCRSFPEFVRRLSSVYGKLRTST